MPAIEQLVVPPFVAVEVPARRRHDAEKRGTVRLRLRGDRETAVVGQRRECIEAGAHVEFAALAIEQGEVDRHPARMRRTAARIGDSVEPRELITVIAGDAADIETRLTIERAESRKQAMALLLMSPEFQRR